MSMGTKICNQCHQEKPLTAFYKEASSKDGRRATSENAYTTQKKEIMTAITKSVTLTKIGTLVLNNLIDLFTQSGANITPERAATILVMLRDHTATLQTNEGRKLFLLARSHIRKTEWDDVVFPKPKSQDDIRWAKEASKIEDHYFEKIKDKGPLIAAALYGPSEDQIKSKCDEFYSKKGG